MTRVSPRRLFTALVLAAGFATGAGPAHSPIKSLADLKGKRVAATPGTDPDIFLLRTLATVGLSGSDITLVPLQHPLGRQAPAAGQVDAWAGLDPFMAEAQLIDHDKLTVSKTKYYSCNARGEAPKCRERRNVFLASRRAVPQSGLLQLRPAGAR